jgi:isocitrate dehydrogenase kinase/phosphatase
MSGEIWYRVGSRDVFPETFEPFLLGHPGVREPFMRHHADLLDASYWQEHKSRILAGHVNDVFPYDAHKRFIHAGAARASQHQVDGASIVDAAHHDLPVQ